MSAGDDGDAGDAGTTREGATARDARQAWISFGDDDATDATVDARAGRGDARETGDRAEDVDELARARARLVEAETNALRATSALDAERRRREEERARTRGLILAAAGCATIETSARDDFGESADAMGGTRMVSAYAAAERGGERRALERFVERAREGKTASEGGVKMTLADAEAVLEDFRTQDAVLEAAKSEATMREALLARLQAETESSARRLRDHDEAHALLTAEISDLRQALAKSKSEANGLAEETTALNEALTSAKAEALEWKNAAETLKQMRPNDAAVGVGEGGTGNKMLVLELECALEALTTTRAELQDVGARLLETQHRAERAEKREAVAAAALEASESRSKTSPSTVSLGSKGASRELKERLDRAEVRVAQLTRRLEAIGGEHRKELAMLQAEHERLSLNLKMMHLTHDDATEVMRLEIGDATREATARASAERDEYWRRILDEERECHANQIESVRQDVENELITKNTKLNRIKHDLVQMLKDAT